MANIQAGQVSYGLRLFAGLLALALVGCGKQGQQVVDNLPWQVATTAQGHTHVFNVDVGKTTLRELIERLHSFPETAVFMDADKHLLLEAYFGKQSLGFLEARLVAELAADQATLEKLATEYIDRQAQPSGSWRLTISEPNQQVANALVVKHLIYIPVADYPEDIVRTRFGEPTQIVAVKETASYWFYPQKGLALLVNGDGGEVFYYSTPADFPALKERLLTRKPEDNHG